MTRWMTRSNARTRRATRLAGSAQTPALLSLTALLGAASLLQAAPASAQKKFRVRDDGGSRVTFVSDATLETINGVSSKVTGSMTVDPTNLSSAKGKFEVPVASLRTGIKLRDEHLQGESWLHASRHPKAKFEITGIRGARALRPNREARVVVTGKFTIHGVTKNVTAKAKVKWIPLTDEIRGTPGINGDVIRARATFKIKLTDYGVSVPAIVRLKVANDIEVTVNFRAIAEKS